VKVKVITPFSKDAEVMVLLLRLMVSIMSSSFVVDPYNVTDYHHRRNPYSTDNQKKIRVNDSTGSSWSFAGWRR
jgi:hypothetical protein